jgi:signal transduction histidine kinase
VALDRLPIRQVLNNLLSNAFKFTPRGGRVRLGAREAGTTVVLEVADSGKGIDPRHAERVFEPYWQADTQSRVGVGLGLHIARQIVELHGGTIGVVPTPDGGATFTIALPARHEAQKPRALPVPGD